MADTPQSQTSATGVQTTGHVWDGDLQEYNNPLPLWWIYGLYVTMAFALVYWVIYPSWPVGKGPTSIRRGNRNRGTGIRAPSC